MVNVIFKQTGRTMQKIRAMNNSDRKLRKKKQTNSKQAKSVCKEESKRSKNICSASSSTTETTPNRNTSTKKLYKILKESNFDRKKLYSSPSVKFEKFVPKVEDILRGKEQEEQLKKMQESVENASQMFLHGLKRKMRRPEKTKKRLRILDCKHLSLRKIENSFNKDVKFLDDIFYGVTYNERHERFKDRKKEEVELENDLRCNEVTWAFTNEQLIHIVSLFRNRYDRGNRYKWSDYYFEVLLPDYCLKLFMDYHHMSYEEATEYLTSLPIVLDIN